MHQRKGEDNIDNILNEKCNKLNGLLKTKIGEEVLEIIKDLAINLSIQDPMDSNALQINLNRKMGYIDFIRILDKIKNNY